MLRQKEKWTALSWWHDIFHAMNGIWKQSLHANRNNPLLSCIFLNLWNKREQKLLLFLLGVVLFNVISHGWFFQSGEGKNFISDRWGSNVKLFCNNNRIKKYCLFVVSGRCSIEVTPLIWRAEAFKYVLLALFEVVWLEFQKCWLQNRA